MLPPGHLTATYILIKTTAALGYPISLNETLVVLASSVALDFDLWPANVFRRNHHDLISHTPLGVFILWLIFIFTAGSYLSLTGQALVLLALLSHLVLDEAGFWFCRLRLRGVSPEPQITWKYPWRKFPERKNVELFHFSFLGKYLHQAKANVAAEIILSLVAVLLIFV